MEAWKKTLTKDSKPCVYFSAWEFENEADPLFSLIGNIKQSFIPYKQDVCSDSAEIHKHCDEKTSTLTTLCQKLNYSLNRMSTFSNVLKLGTAFALDAGRVIAPNTATAAGKIIDSSITAFEEIKESQKNFKDDLTAFVEEITQNNHNHPIVIMIDVNQTML